MIMIIDYDFLSYVIFDQQLKITFRKSSGPAEKIHFPLFTHSPAKKCEAPPLLTLEIFQPFNFYSLIDIHFVSVIGMIYYLMIFNRFCQ